MCKIHCSINGGGFLFFFLFLATRSMRRLQWRGLFKLLVSSPVFCSSSKFVWRFHRPQKVQSCWTDAFLRQWCFSIASVILLCFSSSSELKLEFPVWSLHGKLVLPAGFILCLFTYQTYSKYVRFVCYLSLQISSCCTVEHVYLLAGNFVSRVQLYRTESVCFWSKVSFRVFYYKGYASVS